MLNVPRHPLVGVLSERDRFLLVLYRRTERTRGAGCVNLSFRIKGGLSASNVPEVTLPSFANLYVPVFPARGP